MTTTDLDLVAVDPAITREAGIRLPVVLTRAAWDEAVSWTKADGADTGAYQDEAGRLWDVLTMTGIALRQARLQPLPIYAPFMVLRVPRGVPYAGDEDDSRAYMALMELPLIMVVGGIPLTIRISLPDSPPSKGARCDWTAADPCAEAATHLVDLGAGHREVWTSRETGEARPDPRYRARCRAHVERDLFVELGATVRPIR